MYRRIIEHKLKEALSDTPVVLVVGPRRAGKTTLVEQMKSNQRPYLTLDDPITFNAASVDPTGFIRGLNFAIIDEVQRVPELILAIKRTVDQSYKFGRFLLTGSANVMTLPRVADSLAGRMETLQLLPLARVEIAGRTSSFLHNIFSGRFKMHDFILGDDLTQLILAGGYPEALVRKSAQRRQDWVRGYLNSILKRDLKEIAVVEKLTQLPKFVRLLAQYSGHLANYSDLGNKIDINYKTCQRYISLLKQIYLIATLQPWHTNAIKRIIKTPKLHFLDTGILTASCKLTFDRLKNNRKLLGPILESFIFSEILKLMCGSDLSYELYHFRDHAMREVDIVLERDDGMIAGIEVKASATVISNDFSGLKALLEICKDRFAYGAVLYDGTDLIPFGEKLAAVPISSLWN